MITWLLPKSNMEKMSDAVDALSNLILTLQGDGDYAGSLRGGSSQLVQNKAHQGTTQNDLQRVVRVIRVQSGAPTCDTRLSSRTLRTFAPGNAGRIRLYLP